MNRNRKHAYPLTPVLLQRQWALDVLLLDLNKANGELLAMKSDLSCLERDIDIVVCEWNRQSENAERIAVDRFSIVTRYLRELAGRRMMKQAAIAAFEKKRDELIDHVALAQRELEAIESHRDDFEAGFVKARLATEFKHADDQWMILQGSAIRGNDES